MSRSIAFLGGSFNPLHWGHLKIARESFSQCDLTEIAFIPSYQSPMKTKNDLVSADLRWEILKKVLQKEALFSCHDHEIRKKTISYTVDTIRFFKKKYPSDTLFWILGYDQWLNFHNWKDHRHILEIANLIVCSRPGYASGGTQDFCENVSWIANTDIEISSSEIRSRIRKGLAVDDLLPQEVMNWIEEYELYGYKRRTE